MKHVFHQQLTTPLAFLLALLVLSPAAGAVGVSTSGQGLCTHVYLPDDSAVSGIEVSLLVNGSTVAAAHWGGRAPADPSSRHAGDVPPSDGAWHKLVVDLATGLSSPVAEGDDISDVTWVMHRNAGIRETWSEICLSGPAEIPPVITLLGNNPMFLEQGVAFLDPGSECVDNVDGPCTATVDASALDIDTLGEYEVFYSATDTDGNSSQVIRIVEVVEEDLPPVITVLGDNPAQARVGSEYVEPDPAFSCIDERYDGDCTASVVTDLSGVDTGVLGTQQVVYSVVDSAGHPAQATRDVRVRFERRLEAEHATNPELHMQTWNNPDASGGKQMQWAPGEPWGLLIWDVEVDVTSTYELQFAIACSGNSSPCTARTRDVIVNGVLIGQISFASTGGWSVFKEFEISAVLQAGNNTVQFSTPDGSTLTGPHVDYLDVVFDEPTEWSNVHPPVITLADPGPIHMPLGGTFTMPEFSCVDDVDGDCTDDVVVNGSVLEDEVGTYVITFDVTDAAGNVADQVVLGVVVEGFNLGSLTRSIWTGIGGKPVSSLTGNAAYPDHPSSVGPITSFESAPAGDNYGQRIQGFLHPSVSGEYTFYIASDDASQLWLSTDTNSANAVMIAEVPGSNWTSLRQWDKFAQQTSAPVTLTAGEIYYIEALHKEGSGGQHVSVAWQGPGIVQDIIPGSVLSPLIDINDPPDLQLLGSASQNVLSGTSYTDPGFTCVDDFDGDCTSEVIVGGDVVDPGVDGTYVITYDVSDSDGNVTPQVTRTVTVGPPILGSLTREIWRNLNSGAKVLSLTSHEDFPDNPDVVNTVTSFDSAPGGTTYGQRVHGYLHPTVTGEYTFWIASDEASQLWMNTSGTDPADISMICQVHFINFTGYQEWDKFPQQQSVTITLTAGQAYYIQALHKQAWGAQHLEVAWQGPGFSRQIITGDFLSPMP